MENPYLEYESKFDMTQEKFNPYKIKVIDIEVPRTQIPNPRINTIDFSKGTMLAKSIIGKDLSTFSLPCFLNEPSTIIQKLAESYSWVDYFIAAAEEPDALKRMANIATYLAAI